MSGQHTPGPWAWFGNARSNSLYLATKHSGRRYVMGFKRWGFSGAQPQFQPAERGLVDASKLFTFEVGDRDVRGVDEAKANTSVYRLDINGIDCADARLIAAAPELLDALRPFAEAAERYYETNRNWIRTGATLTEQRFSEGERLDTAEENALEAVKIEHLLRAAELLAQLPPAPAATSAASITEDVAQGGVGSRLPEGSA